MLQLETIVCDFQTNLFCADISTITFSPYFMLHAYIYTKQFLVSIIEVSFIHGLSKNGIEIMWLLIVSMPLNN